MKKVFILLLTLILSLCSLVSCEDLSHFGPPVLAYYVPTFGTPDTKDLITHELDEDEYGRILFIFWTNGSHHTGYGYNENDVVLAIMQKSDRSNVYFYEDSFFIILPDGKDPESIDVNSQEILELKEANDWGKELNESKLSKREIKITFDLYYFPRLPAWCDHNSDYGKKMLKDFEYVHSFNDSKGFFYDCDGEKLLYWVYAESDEGRKNYFCICTSDNQYSYMEITDIYSYQEDLAEFKKANGWNYG